MFGGLYSLWYIGTCCCCTAFVTQIKRPHLMYCGQSEHIIGSSFDFNPTIVVRPSQTVLKCARLYDTFFLYYYYCISFGLILILTFYPAATLLLKESLDISAMTNNKTYLKWLYIESRELHVRLNMTPSRVSTRTPHDGHERMLLLLLSIEKYTKEVDKQLDLAGWIKPGKVMEPFSSSKLNEKRF